MSYQIAQHFLNVNLMLINITTALALPLRVPLALNRTTLIIVKRHYVMKSICGREGEFSKFRNFILAMNSSKVITCFISLGKRFQISGLMYDMVCNHYLNVITFLLENMSIRVY